MRKCAACRMHDEDEQPVDTGTDFSVYVCRAVPPGLFYFKPGQGIVGRNLSGVRNLEGVPGDDK